MIKIYEQTGGKNWRTKEHWGESEGEVCERWKGVVCDRLHMHVVSLFLHSNFLEGSSILSLVFLCSSFISGTLPQSISQLKKLGSISSQTRH